MKHYQIRGRSLPGLDAPIGEYERSMLLRFHTNSNFSSLRRS